MVGLVGTSWSRAASGAPFELAWSAPEGCPSGASILAATRARLGESSSDAPPELFVQGTVRSGPGGFDVTLALTDVAGDAVGERALRFEERHCAAIEEPVSVVLAMMIAVARLPAEASGDPRERSDVRRDSGQGPPAAAKRPPRKPTQPPAPPPLVQRFWLGSAGVASLGVLPGVGAGASLRAMYAHGALLVIGLEAAFELGDSVEVRGGETGFQLFSTSARIGLQALQAGRFELIPTLGARFGVIHTSPSGFLAAREELRATILAGAGVLGRARIAPQLYLEALPELEVVFIRDQFEVREGPQFHRAHRASPIAGRLSLGISYEFL